MTIMQDDDVHNDDDDEDNHNDDKDVKKIQRSVHSSRLTGKS